MRASYFLLATRTVLPTHANPFPHLDKLSRILSSRGIGQKTLGLSHTEASFSP